MNRQWQHIKTGQIIIMEEEPDNLESWRELPPIGSDRRRDTVLRNAWDEIQVKNMATEDIMKALSRQVGGSHYKNMPIQPIEFCHKNKLGACETLAIKYLCRHKEKNKKEDLVKAIHVIQLLIELEYPRG